MVKIADNTVARVIYTGKLEDGEVFDTNEGGEPLTFLVGHGQMISGFEEELMGASVGDRRSFTLTPDRAYGHRNEDHFQVVDKSVFGTEMPIEVGMSSYAQTEGGGMTMFTITKIEGDQVTVDFNHVMAGKTLNFSVEVIDVRDATREELSHGHAHGPGGAHHESAKDDSCGPGCGCH